MHCTAGRSREVAECLSEVISRSVWGAEGAVTFDSDHPDGDDGEPSPLPHYRNSGGHFVSSFSFDLNVHRLDDG